MHFDGSINVGGVLAFLALVFGFYKAHRSNIERFQSLETKMEIVYAICLGQMKK